MAEGIFIRLLGPVTGSRDGVALDLGSPRQRAVMAVLASRPGRVVTLSRLIGGVWGDQPPRSAEQNVYTYISGLRRTLEPGRGRRGHSEVLAGTTGGYELRLDPRHIDAGAFADHIDTSRRLQESGDHTGVLGSLDLALRMWNGQALTGIPGPFAEVERARLHELRLVALERRAETLLRLSRPEEDLLTLRDLTRRHPLRERVRELLMLALHQCGRQAEALEVFEEGRRVLAEELGIDPGPGLRACHALVLGSVDEGRRPPRQLPRELTGFAGRTREAVRLRSLLAPEDGAAPVPLVVVSGAAGVGKSTLAVQVAHEVKDRFPDGQLFVNLRGATPGVPALTAHEVIGRFLRSLGLPSTAVPQDEDEAAAVWRSELDGRRMLVVLDDAAGLTQIQPLLSAPRGTGLLVTSRENLFPGDDSVRLRLDRMPHAEATGMLAALAGAERIAAEPAATAELIDLCDGLPLALRIAGARLADRPDWPVSSLVARLREEEGRLRELEAGDLAVRSSLSSGHRSLRRSDRATSRTAARVLVLLGLLPVQDTTAEVAAALLGTPVPEAERAMERLVDAHLLERGRPGHFQFHDLVRLYAAELAREQITSPEPLHAALRYYVVSAQHASETWHPLRVQPAPPDIGPGAVVPHHVGGRAEAAAWLMEEEPNLTAAAAHAMAQADPRTARLGVALTFALLWAQESTYRAVELFSLNRQALEVSRRLGEEAVGLEALGHMARGLQLLGRVDDAVAHLEDQLELAKRLGDRFAEQRALGNLANTHLGGKRYERALHYAGRQLTIARELDSRGSTRYAGLVAAEAYEKLGRLPEARQEILGVLAAAEQDEDVLHQGQAHRVLGQLSLRAGDGPTARHHLLRGLTLTRDCGHRLGELRCLTGLSVASRLMSDLDDAMTHADEALRLAERLGDGTWQHQARREHASVRELLARRSTARGPDGPR